ncbi:MAG TPA: hypothetical protein VD788_17630, partial [Candidatus Polarisedimenticolaceae bacterium]|nr:hypothetical protein [Candidatus Polarisedimenticolaceae bacterium]
PPAGGGALPGGGAGARHPPAPHDTGSQRGLAAGCLTGLAFLIKGPVGVVLPLLIVLAGRTAAGREILPRPRAALLAVAGWLAVVLPWGLAFVERVGAGAAAAIVRGEALDRFFAGTDHVEPPWFFAAVVAVGFFPWIGPLVVALPRALFQRDDPAARTALYAAAGLIVGLLFFSIGKSKLASYAVPLAPLAAILAAWELGQELRAPRERTLAPTVLVALLAAAAVALLIARDVGLPAEAASFAPAGAAVLGVGSLAAMAGLLLRRPRIVWGAAALASTTLLVAATALLLPAIASRRSARALIDGVPALASTERSLVVVDMRVPSLTYYLDRVPELVPMERLAERIRNGDRPLFVFDEGDLTHAPAAVERLERVGAHGKYVVLREEPSPRVPLDASAPDG